MKRFLLLAITWFAAVTAAQGAPWDSGCIQPIALGQTINGTLTTSDCAYYLGTETTALYYTDVYSFSGTIGQQIAVSMSSTAVDAWLDLYGVNDVSGMSLYSDDDGGGGPSGTDARVPSNSGYFTLPATGTYYIWANTSYSNQTGDYTLTLTASQTITPPPVGSPLPQNALYYISRLLGFASGNIANTDPISLILRAGLGSVLTPGSTCPVAAIDPPLDSLTDFPPALTLTFNFDGGCTVTNDTGDSTVAGNAVVVFSNLALTSTMTATSIDTSIVGNADITLTGVVVNGMPVDDGVLSATFNMPLDSSPLAAPPAE